MEKSRARLAAFAAAFTTLAAAGFAQPPPNQPMWTVVIDDRTPSATDRRGQLMRQAWAPSGQCLAISTDHAVHILDTSGRELWRWAFREQNRLTRANVLAVSPRCDMVAIGGDTDYRYVWIARRRGGSAFFKTLGTPMTVVFSTRGDVVAARTGSLYLNSYLATTDGRVVSQGDLHSLPVRWPFDVSFYGDPSGPEFVNADADRLLLSDPLSFVTAAGTSHSSDGHSSVSWRWPSHGSLVGWLDFTEVSEITPKWTKAVGCPSAIMTADGSRVVVQGELIADDAATEDFDCSKMEISVIDREGQIVSRRKISKEGAFVGLAPDGETFLYREGEEVRRYDLAGHVSWVIPVLEQADLTLSPDRTMLVVREGTRVRLFRVPT